MGQNFGTAVDEWLELCDRDLADLAELMRNDERVGCRELLAMGVETQRESLSHLRRSIQASVRLYDILKGT